ncbi:outer membrane beta-barrel protein [Denitratisoma sp. agr-D3]
MQPQQKTQLKPAATSWANRYRSWALAGIVATSTLMAGGAQAQSNDTGWYGGINLGRSNGGVSGSQIDGVLGNQGLTGTSSTDGRDTTYSLNLGYQFNRNFAVEGGYTDFGKYKVNSNVTAPAGDTASGDWKSTGWTAVGVGILPIDNALSVYGKAGVVLADTKLSLGSSTGANAISGGSHSSTNGTYGLGVSYDFGNRVVGKLEWNRYQGLGDSATTGSTDLNTYTMGVAYKF